MRASLAFQLSWMALLFLFVCGCPSQEVAKSAAEIEYASVTVIGIDGATWNVIDPMLAAGALPTLAKLIETGVRAPLRSRKPLVSPPVWTTIATGVPRQMHGIRGFVTGDRLVSSRDRRVPALWTHASAAGLRTAVLGWWATYPAETLNGVMVSERAFKTREWSIQSLLTRRQAMRNLLISPDSLAPRLAELLSEHSEPHLSEREATRQRMRIEDSAVVRSLEIAREAEGPFDLEMILVRGVDVVSHHFWKFHEPNARAYSSSERPSAEEIERNGDVVRAQYRLVDSLIGELIALDPERNFILVSDHGFEAGNQPYGRGMLSGTHQSQAALRGIFIAAGSAFAQGRRSGEISILDIAPLVLRLWGMQAPRMLRGTLHEDVLDTSWLLMHPVSKSPPYSGPASNLSEQAMNAEDPEGEAGLREELEALGYIQ